MRLWYLSVLLLSLTALTHAANESSNTARGEILYVSNPNQTAFISIEGEAARRMFADLTQVQERRGSGEVDPYVIFRTGKSYRCFNDNNYFKCDVFISNK